jgi:hypothetical protein
LRMLSSSHCSWPCSLSSPLSNKQHPGTYVRPSPHLSAHVAVKNAQQQPLQCPEANPPAQSSINRHSMRRHLSITRSPESAHLF